MLKVNKDFQFYDSPLPINAYVVYGCSTSMLKQYGPEVSEDTLRRLVKAFSELRSKADEGTIQYPYSTREVVNIVKHLQKFPNEGLGQVVRNVFDFDAYDQEARKSVEEVLQKHGM